MDRTLYTDEGVSTPRTCEVILTFTAGTSGIIPTDLFTNTDNIVEFIESVELTTTGIITVTLQDTYAKFIQATGQIIQAGGSYTNTNATRVVCNSTTDPTSATAPVIVCRLLTGAGVTADMQTGDFSAWSLSSSTNKP